MADTLENIDNGELGPRSFSQTNTLAGFYRLRLPSENRPRIDDAILELPAFVDSNRNGVADFFDQDQAVEAFSGSGTFDDTNQNIGGISVTWSRQAGSGSGNCDIQFVSSSTLAFFSLPFTLLEYRGTLNYSNLSGRIIGSVSLTNGTRRITGQLSLQVSDKDTLRCDSGQWSLGNAGTSWIASGPLRRVLQDYVTDIEFTDGNPDTALPDYQRWILAIHDTNDRDGNGVPNLSDVSAPSRPQLHIEALDLKLARIVIQGSTGGSYEIQSATSLPPSDWSAWTNITLTNLNQVLELPVTEHKQSFFRAIVKQQ